MIYYSTEIVEAFVATRLTPVWNQYGDGEHTACGLTALRASGQEIPPWSLASNIVTGWDALSLEHTCSDEYRHNWPQRYHANLASVQMWCTLRRVARGRWQREILAHLIAYGCVANPMSALAGRARSYAGRYRRSLDNLLRRLRDAGPWPLYRIVDRTGRVWYATRKLPDGPAYPSRSVSEIVSEDAR